MSDQHPTHATLQAWLSLTREEELDCDRFNALLATWIDGSVADPRLLELLEHHRRLCAECDEEATLLEIALGDGD